MLHPGRYVALLGLARLIAHLQLDGVAAARVVLRHGEELLKARLAVAPEEACQPQRKGSAGTAELAQLRQMPDGVLGYGGRRRRSDLPGDRARVDSEAHAEAWTLGHLPGVGVADAAGRAGLGAGAGRPRHEEPAQRRDQDAQNTTHRSGAYP
jgi:hypothetical protein